MSKLQKMSKFMDRIHLRDPDAVLIDYSAEYASIFEEMTREENDDLLNVVPEAYEFPDFRERGVTTYSSGDINFHQKRRKEEIPDSLSKEIRQVYENTVNDTRMIHVPVDAWNSFDARVPDESYIDQVDFETFDRALSNYYNMDAEPITIQKSKFEKWLDDSQVEEDGGVEYLE